MTERRANLCRSYFGQLVRQELIQIEQNLHGDNQNVQIVVDDNDIVENFGNNDGVNNRGVEMPDDDNRSVDDDIERAEDGIVDDDSNEEVELYYTSDDNDNGSADDDGSGEEDASFKTRLGRLVIENNFSRYATNQLLSLLIEFRHGDLPKTNETLLHTPHIPITVRKVYPGEYYHIGLKKSLQRCNYEFLIHQDVIEIDISIDGLSLSKSSKLKMWPILGAFPNKPNTSPFVIGAYTGYADPSSINDFLAEFVDEVRDLLENGIEVTPQLIWKPMKIRAYICDAPARAFLTGTFSHLANIGCNKCDQHCVKICGKRTFLTTRGNIRTDESFRNRVQVEHHKPIFVAVPSFLETLGTGMVSQVPNDPMHLVDEGVFARILGSLFFGPCRSVRLQMNAKELMDEMYISFGPYVPCEFSRKPRSILNEFTRWKGVEYRFWGLYGGFVVLKDFVGPELYKHFLQLFTAIRLVAYPSTHLLFADFAERLIESFVGNYGNIYDPKELVYNIHALLHIVEDVRLYGPLYSFSAYRFENHMREINKHINKTNLILQQLSKRLEEINISNEKKQENLEENGFVGAPRPYDSDLFPGCTTSYKAFKYDAFVLKNNLSDSCCLLNSGQAVEIQHFLKIEDREVIVCKVFRNARDFFTEPIASCAGLGIMLVDGTGDEEIAFDLTEVKYKLVRLPYQQFFVLIPMIHQYTN